jgi:hypothetical protein
LLEYLDFSGNDDDDNDDVDLVDTDTLVVYHINDSVLNNCPHIDISVRDRVVNCILDTGAQASILSERVYNDLVTAGVEILVLPIQNVVLISAFGSKTKRIKNQAFLEFKLGEDVFEHVLLISSQLAADVILGSDFCSLHGFILDFNSKCIEYAREGQVRTVAFNQNVETEPLEAKQVQDKSPIDNSQNRRCNFQKELIQGHFQPR